MKKIITNFSKFLENTDNTLKSIDIFNDYSNKWKSIFPILGELILQTDKNNGKYEWEYSKDYTSENTTGEIKLKIGYTGKSWDIDFIIQTEIEKELWLGIIDREENEEKKKEVVTKKEGLNYEPFLKELKDITTTITNYYKN